MNTNLMRIQHSNNYQQKLIDRLSQATKDGNEFLACRYAESAIRIAHKRQWPQICANAHYLMYVMYNRLRVYKEAETEIDKALFFIKKELAKNHSDAILRTCCEYLIHRASFWVRQENLFEAVLIYQEALEMSLDLEDWTLSIGIYETLAICQRIIGNSREAWITFVSGWELLVLNGDTTDIFCKIYALEMLKIDPKCIDAQYIVLFNTLWGIGWEESLFSENNVNSLYKTL